MATRATTELHTNEKCQNRESGKVDQKKKTKNNDNFGFTTIPLGFQGEHETQPEVVVVTKEDLSVELEVLELSSAFEAHRTPCNGTA